MIGTRARIRRRARRERSLAACLLLASLGLVVDPVRAEWQPETAASAAAAIRTRAFEGGRGYGAAFTIDVWQRFGLFRLGGALGVRFLGGSDEAARAYMPVGFSFALADRSRTVGYDFRVRTGAWLGATDAGLRAGYFVEAGMHASFRVTDSFSVTLGVDTSLLLFHGNALIVAPGLSLVFTPREDS